MAGVEEEEGEVAALRAALRQQAREAEELRAELEEERQAAASGADEALAMIVRLQAEKAAERMEAEQFRRVAEERIRHDEETLAFLKAVVFHQEMEISSLNRRLLAVQAAGGDGDPFSAAAAGDLPWLRRLVRSGSFSAASRRNASLPAARLEELCSELDGAAGADGDDHPCKSLAGDRRPARTASDIGEAIGREREWAPQPQQPRLLHRSASASHRLLPRRAPSGSAQRAARSAARAAPEIIAEEDERSSKSSGSNTTSLSLEADIEQIKAIVQSLQAELTRLRESAVSVGDAHCQLLAEIHSKLDGGAGPGTRGGHGSSPAKLKKATSSSKEEEQSYQYQPQGELLMNHFIEVRGLTFSAAVVRPLVRAAASMSLLRCILVLVLAVGIRRALINS